MHEQYKSFSAHEVARQEEVDKSLGTLYERLQQLSSMADAQIPTEAEKGFAPLIVTFANAKGINVHRYQGIIGEEGPSFYVYGRASIRDRVTCALKGNVAPLGDYVLRVQRSKEKSTVRASFQWFVKPKAEGRVILRSTVGPSERTIDSTSPKFPIDLVKKTQTQLSQDVKQIQNWAKKEG